MSETDFDKAMKKADEKFAELHAHIGSVRTAFAHVELELINAVGLLLDDGELIIGEIVANRLSYTQTVDLFDRLVKYRLRKSVPDELQPLVTDLRMAAKFRNDVVHSSWVCSLDEGPELYQTRVRSKHISRSTVSGTIPLEEFPQIENFISDLFMQLQTFETEYL